MCEHCWQEEGAYQIDNPRVREAAKAIEAVFDKCCMGGSLHAVIDDWNLEDDNLKTSLQLIEEDYEALPWARDFSRESDEQKATQRRCYELLKSLSYQERVSALALHDGYWQ